MANLTSTLTVRLLDMVSGPATAASRALLGIGNAAAAANARGAFFGPGMVTNLRAAEGALSRMATTMRSMSAISFPAGIAALFGARQIYNFTRAGNAFQAVTRATDAQRASVERLAQALNALFPLNNTQIMNAAAELGRAGLNVEQIRGILRGSLNLSLAGDLDTAQAADIATNILTAMRLPMRTTEEASASMTRIMDALAYAATRSNTTVAQMGDTFKYVAPLASAFGLNIEQVAAATMVMANNGIRGSEAGVAMRSALVRMIRPTREMLAALGRLNINITDFVLPGRQITAQDIIGTLQSSGINASTLSGEIGAALNDPELRTNISALTARLSDIVSSAPGAESTLRPDLAGMISDALTAAGNNVDMIGFVRALRERGAAALAEMPRIFDVRQGARLITLLMGDLDRVIADVTRDAPGSAEQMARQRMRGIVGAWDGFTASLENLALRIGEAGITNHIIGFLSAMESGIKKLASLPDSTLVIGAYATALLALVPVVGGAIAGVLALSRAIALLTGATAVGTATAGAGTATAIGAGAVGAGAASSWMRRLGINSVRGAMGRLGLLGLGWAAGDAAWRLSGGHDAVARLFAPPAPGTPEAAQRERMERLRAALDARHTATTAADAVDPAMLAPRPDSVMAPRPDLAADAAGSTFAAFRARAMEELRLTRELIERESAAMMQALNFTASPLITPRIDMSGLNGIHADVGTGPR